MKNDSRRHHYISQFYLRGFAQLGSGQKNPQITVINLKEKKSFKTTAKNIAGIRDFNRVDLGGVKPDAFEETLSNFETKAAQAIRNVHETKKFEGEDRLLILELIAMFAVRNPNMRENIAGILADITGSSLERLLRGKKEFRNETIALIKKLKPELGDNISDSEILNFMTENLKFKVSTAYHIYAESIMIDAISGFLDMRNWTLVQSSPETGPMIASDGPVILCWDNPDEVPAIFRYSPGFGLKKTVVYFPLSQHLALIGKFDHVDMVTPPNQMLVAVNNTFQIMFSTNQIYAPNLNFRFHAKENGLIDGSELLKGYGFNKLK